MVFRGKRAQAQPDADNVLIPKIYRRLAFGRQPLRQDAAGDAERLSESLSHRSRSRQPGAAPQARARRAARWGAIRQSQLTRDGSRAARDADPSDWRLMRTVFGLELHAQVALAMVGSSLAAYAGSLGHPSRQPPRLTLSSFAYAPVATNAAPPFRARGSLGCRHGCRSFLKVGGHRVPTAWRK
jgi:hypothetical protein